MSHSLEKALRLVDLVASGSCTLSTLTERSGLSRSTVHRLAATLVRHKYLEYADNAYSIGYKFLEFAERKKLDFRVPAAAKAQMLEYSRKTGETMHFGILEGQDIVIVEKVTGSRQLQMNSYVGLRSPAYRTGIGKVLIAARPESEWESFLHLLEPETKRRLVKELRGVGRQGYAFDLGESNAAVYCVAAPIRAHAGHVVASASFSGASLYFTPTRLEELSVEIVQCAEKISATID